MQDSDLVEMTEQEVIQDDLANIVLDYFSRAVHYRQNTIIQNYSVDEWFSRLRNAYHGVHEPEELAGAENMRSYFGLCRTKANMVSSYLRGKFANQSVPPFKLSPTPIVDLPKGKQDEALEQTKAEILYTMAKNGIDISTVSRNGYLIPEVAQYVKEVAEKSIETFRSKENAIASDSCGKMETLIKDQLIDSSFSEAMSEALLDLALYPMMCVCLEYSPVINYKWSGNKLIKKEEVVPKFRRVHPANMFFASNCTSAGDGDYVIELVRRDKSELESLKDSEEYGYDKEAIEFALEHYSFNDNWLKAKFEGENLSWLEDKADVIYTLKCQCKVKGETLKDYGIEVKTEELSEYFAVDIEVCNGRVLRCAKQPLIYGERSYFSAGYKRIAGEPWGMSVAMMVYDRQLVVNRIQYDMLLNAHYASGPMIEVNAMEFEDLGAVKMEPFTRVYSNPMQQNMGRGIVQHQVNPVFPVLYNFMTNQIRLADDECGLPAFLQGQAGIGGAGSTLGGLAMLTDNALMGLEDCAFNIDTFVILPAIKILYYRNMQGKDNGVKSDARVIATGLLGLKQEVNKSKELAGLTPQLAALAQQGVVPQGLYSDIVRDYLDSMGIDTRNYFNSQAVDNELNAVGLNNPTTINRLDGRSLKNIGNIR